MMRIFALLGALNMLVAVGFGAFGAHGLKDRVDAAMLSVWQTGVLYHLVHALGLFVIAWLVERTGSNLLGIAGWIMLAGIILFCGSLYLLVLTDTRALGAITPFGGVCFLLAWALTAWAIWRLP